MSVGLASATSPHNCPHEVQIMSVPPQRLHARRTPPRDVLPLPGNKRQKLDKQVEAPIRVQNSSKIHPVRQQTSQGSGSERSASKWFDQVNTNVSSSLRNNTQYSDEPPFYMSMHKNYLPSNFVASNGSKAYGAHSKTDSENEDLRGVIDDLTVENKRLKHILRSHNSRRNSPNDSEGQDRLFEVRMHGLPPEKRRELEFLLKNFATSVHATAPSLSHSTSNSAVSSASQPGKATKTDSGYASNSGQTSLAQSHAGQSIPGLSKKSKNTNVKNYLHDIPDSLAPRPNRLKLSDRAKMALVVRRLEQLFTGKNAAPGEHSQPLQQQEVSNIAARADARNSKPRKVEGTREAHILPPDTKVNFDTMEIVPQKRAYSESKTSERHDQSTPEVNSSTISRPGSPNQRPTRPLDLDIHRAQIAAENIEYIRHLGLSAPHMNLQADAKDSSWIYLNLLINMAQLHTINVTPEFVRRAVKKLSTKFELSMDGYKVRWIGGPDGTVFSNEEERALEAVDFARPMSPHDSAEDSGTAGSSSRSKTDSFSNAVTSQTPSEEKTNSALFPGEHNQHKTTDVTATQPSPYPLRNVKVGSTFDYKPIVFRGNKVPDSQEAYLQDDTSLYGTSSGDSSGLVQSPKRSNSGHKRTAGEGPITFFNNPYFCSDYSGDRTLCKTPRGKGTIPDEILGISSHERHEESPVRYGDACYYTPQFGPRPHQPSEHEKTIPWNLSPLSHSGEDETQPMELPASGLAGIMPSDNFAVDVKVDMVRVDRKDSSQTQNHVPFTGTSVPSRYVYHRNDSRKIDLMPSRLPPPSYIFFTSSSSSDNAVEEFSDDDSDESSASAAEDDYPGLPAFLQHWSADNSGDTNESDDEDQESSVDMLADARAADPETIAEQERQYMITLPGNRAAGSLAATVGASRSPSLHHEIASDVSAHGSDMDVDEV